jgi:hypothetical protein
MMDVVARVYAGGLGLAVLLLWGASALAAEPQAPDAGVPAREGLRAVEHTTLEALPGQRARLIEFIRVNWFAMDAEAVRQGLMVSYQLLEKADDKGPGEVIVAVTYPTAEGYDAVRERFEAIRRAHRKVLIEGKDLPALGRVVGSRRFLVVGGGGGDAGR